jgi:hypothetical protein
VTVGIHLYCIVPASHPAPPVSGIEDVAVGCFAAGAVACLFTTHATRPQPSARTLRQHNAVIEAAMTGEVTPVPLRFGHWFETESDAAGRVADEAPRWADLLARFAGHAEFGVRFAQAESVDTARDVHPTRLTSGKAYMTALVQKEAEAARRRRAADELADWLARRVGVLAADTRVDAAARGTLGVAHLVAWRDADAYRSILQEARQERADIRSTVSGPWPPYSFVA